MPLLIGINNTLLEKYCQNKMFHVEQSVITIRGVPLMKEDKSPKLYNTPITIPIFYFAGFYKYSFRITK